MSSGTIALTKCLSVTKAAEERGIDVSVWRARLADDADPTKPLQTHVSTAEYLDLWQFVTEKVNDPSFPLQVAATRIADLNLVGLLLTTSSDLGEALAFGQRYQRLWLADGRWETVPSVGNQTCLSWETYGPKGAQRAIAARAAIEFAAAAMVLGMRGLSQKPIVPLAATFAHPPPRQIDAHARVFGDMLVFDAPADTLRFDTSVFSLRIPGANPPVKEYLRTQCDELLTSLDAPDDVVARLRQILMNQVPTGTPSRRLAGRRLGMSERTLQRRLRDRGTSFREVLDEVRFSLADALLAQHGMSVAEVASRTGFASASAFHRAYRRWSDSAPRGRRSRSFDASQEP